MLFATKIRRNKRAVLLMLRTAAVAGEESGAPFALLIFDTKISSPNVQPFVTGRDRWRSATRDSLESP